MTTTQNPNTIIEMFNMRTGKIIRTFTNRKHATEICRCYNDLALYPRYNTRTVKVGA